MTHCGIDFGTSNTTLSVLDGGTPRLIPLEQDKDTIPSALFFPANRGLPLFGRAAIAAYLNGEEGRFMRSLNAYWAHPSCKAARSFMENALAFPF